MGSKRESRVRTVNAMIVDVQGGKYGAKGDARDRSIKPLLRTPSTSFTKPLRCI